MKNADFFNEVEEVPNNYEKNVFENQYNDLHNKVMIKYSFKICTHK